MMQTEFADQLQQPARVLPKATSKMAQHRGTARDPGLKKSSATERACVQGGGAKGKTAKKQAAQTGKKHTYKAAATLDIQILILFSTVDAPTEVRWDRNHPVVGATIEVSGTSVQVKTDNTGTAKLSVADVSGTHTLKIKPPAGMLSTQPAGPSLATGTSSDPQYMFREFEVNVEVESAKFKTDPAPTLNLPGLVAGTPPYAAVFEVTAAKILLDWKPDWIKSPNRSAITGKTNECLVIHQTSVIARVGNHINTLTNNTVPVAKRVSAHYLVDVDGHAIKLVHESEASWHAGHTFWQGKTKLNGLSVGIETVHTDVPTPQSFTEAQYTTLLRLVTEIRAAHAGITRQRVVGHSDVKIQDANDFKLSRSRRGCPGDQFDWARFEAANMARTVTAGPPPETIYGIKAGEKLARAPAKKAPVASPEVEELKRDLSAIGYSINATDGVTITNVFDEVLEFAVTHFQIRYFSGSRLASRPKRLGTVDYDTAFTIKMVLGDSQP